MVWIRQRYEYLFRSTKGLILVAIALISLVTAIWGMLSGPMMEWGVRDVVVRLFGMDLQPIEREARIITLYHSIAMAVIAIEVYIITGMLKMTTRQQVSINTAITVGYMAVLFGGLAFGYFGHNWVMHGIFIAGQAVVFFAGLLLAAALWPWRKEFHIEDKEYAHTPKMVSLERVAFFTMAVATLGSAIFGAIPGANFGNGFESFLAEDVIRNVDKTGLQRSIIGHLHIMLTLIAIALALIIGRWFDFKGRWHKVAMPLMIVGTIVISLGAWSVIVVEWAHTIIYVGSVFVLLAALFLVIFGFGKLIRTGLAEKGIQKASFGQKMRALLRDPLRFGTLWQMVFMNFTVSGIGIFMAVRLDEIFRVWPWREERIVLTGHWHILSGIIATIILLYYADLVGLKGKARQWFGWTVIIFSDLAFAAVTVFAIKRLFVTESDQQSLVNWTMLLGDIGLAVVLVALAALLIWKLIDLFKRNGRWKKELAETGFDQAEKGGIQ